MTNPIFIDGINVLWRNKNEVQFGIDPSTNVRTDSQTASHLIANCTGQLTLQEILHSALRNNLDADAVALTISRLINLGLMKSKSELVKQRSFADTQIEIQGAGRLGTTVAVMLAHSGFTNIHVHDETKVTLADVTAWGASRIDVGARRDHTALMIIERVHRGTWPRMLRPTKAAGKKLVILCPDQVGPSIWFPPNLTDQQIATDSPHIFAGAGRNQGQVSTILNPTQTACLRCHHARLTDIDQAWPLLSAQMVGRPAQDLAPASLILHVATLVVEIVRDWAQTPNKLDSGIWEIDWPSANKTLVPLSTHGACGCQWNIAA